MLSTKKRKNKSQDCGTKRVQRQATVPIESYKSPRTNLEVSKIVSGVIGSSQRVGRKQWTKDKKREDVDSPILI